MEPKAPVYDESTIGVTLKAIELLSVTSEELIKYTDINDVQPMNAKYSIVERLGKLIVSRAEHLAKVLAPTYPNCGALNVVSE